MGRTCVGSSYRKMIKYVFIQNEPFLLPRVLDKYLREFSDTTAGINVQSVAQGLSLIHI